jgi:hypothetical protein
LASALIAFSFLNLPQEYELLEKVKSKLLNYGLTKTPEKTYLHTNKDFYTNGETIWFKTYLVNGISHRTSKKSNVVYVELVNDRDSVVAQRKLFINEIGAAGDIEIGENIEQGNYTLRSYTKYMLNEDVPVVFEKNIPIFFQEVRKIASPDQISTTQYMQGFDNNSIDEASVVPNVKFFPEGGHLVKGLPTTLGLEVLDQNGNGVTLKGVIKDSKGKVIEPFESLEFGLGRVGFTPTEDGVYYASVLLNGKEEKFPIPKVLPTGHVLSLKNRDDHILVQVASTKPNGLEGTLLIGHLRGEMIFKRIGNAEDKASYATKIFTKELQDGLAQFTLFSAEGEPISERLIFIDNPSNDAKFTISSSRKVYGPRERVKLNMMLEDENGAPLRGDFSLGVISKSGIKEATANNIKSWLLLDSDLGGTVQKPDYFFADDAKERKFLLDALMLTHGWRRFVWKDMLSEKVDKTPNYSPEKGIMITGKTTRFGNPNKAKETVATLNLYDWPDLINSKQETNAQGAFSFGPFYFNDSIEATVEAYDSVPKWAYKRKNLSVLVDEQSPKLDSELGKTKRTDRQTIELSQEYLRDEYLKKVNDFNYDPKKVTHLDEAVVKEKKRTRESVLRQLNFTSIRTSGPFTTTVYKHSIPGAEAMSALDLVGRLPGVSVTGPYPTQNVAILNIGVNTFIGADPLFLVDGNPTNLSFVQAMRANEVSFIDVPRGPELTIFGSRGGNGVIALYTNDLYDPNKQNTEEYPGIVNFKIPGFYKAREFYKPDYIKESPEKPDYRTTLFWKPEITLDEEGKSAIDFFTGDKTGEYWVKVEGLTNDGRPVNGIFDLQVMESY